MVAGFSEFQPCPELGAQETIDSIQKSAISPNLGSTGTFFAGHQQLENVSWEV